MKLLGYSRSAAAYRVRIALALKRIDHDGVAIDLRQNAQSAPEYAALNPTRMVPALIDGANVLTQSLAIVEYLDEIHPEPPLLPADPVGRARVRALAQTVACDIHPLRNLRVMAYLREVLQLPEAMRQAWVRHWVCEGFTAIEQMLARSAETGTYCHGDTPTLADLALVPEVYSARQFDLDLALYPTIRRIHDACQALPAFQAAHPDRQPEATA